MYNLYIDFAQKRSKWSKNTQNNDTAKTKIMKKDNDIYVKFTKKALDRASSVWEGFRKF